MNDKKAAKFEIQKFDKPALILRKLKYISKETIHAMLAPYEPSKIQFNESSLDKNSDSVVVYFDSEDTALIALSKLKGAVVEGQKISATYR